MIEPNKCPQCNKELPAIPMVTKDGQVFCSSFCFLASSLDVDCVPPTPEMVAMKEKIDGLCLPEPSGETFNVSILSEVELVTRYNSLTQQLMHRREAMKPHTDTGRDMHNEREAYQVEMRRRRLL